MVSDPRQTSLVIATYNWPSALDLVLKSILEQSVLPGEIVIADDGSTNETKQVIDRYKELFKIPIKYHWHEDRGYQKSIILNKAMRNITKDYIIQIDGDVILEHRFIEDHIKSSETGCWLNGSRVLLGKTVSKEIQSSGRIEFSPFSKDITNRLNAVRSSLLADLLFSKSAFSTEARGCNMSYWRKDFFQVNGFNEDIVGYSREDSELAARLTNIGVKRKKLKFRAVQYHIDHKLASRERSEANINIEKETIAQGKKVCINGLEKLDPSILG
tara:strand:- start:174946 stop:175761 length:816 start_codon:yes stop_codon:yes gene_type:complete